MIYFFLLFLFVFGSVTFATDFPPFRDFVFFTDFIADVFAFVAGFFFPASFFVPSFSSATNLSTVQPTLTETTSSPGFISTTTSPFVAARLLVYHDNVLYMGHHFSLI